MPAGTGEQRHLRRFTILYIKKQSVHYRILRSYKDTLHGQSDCFSRSLHEYRDGAGKENHRCEQADRKQCEYNRRAADDGADLFRVLFPEITGDQDGDAHCELCHNKGDEV